MPLSLQSRRSIYVCCASGFRFGSHLCSICFGASGYTFHGTDFYLLFKNFPKLKSFQKVLPAIRFTSIYHITALPILHFVPRAKDFYQLLCTIPFTKYVVSPLGGLQPRWPLVLRSLSLPHALYRSMYLEVIAVLQYNEHDDVVHAYVSKACVSSK